LRALPELTKASAAALEAAAGEVRHKHCLAVVAREHGFASWAHATRVLEGDEGERDYGALLYDADTAGALNAWFSDYGEARAALDALRAAGQTRYLLCYRRQFFVVESAFIASLGLRPDDPDWEALDFDWARPRDPHARARLYANRIQAARRGL